MRSPLLLAGLLASLGAAGAAEPPLTAESAARIARQRNPELHAAHSLIAEAEARARRTGRLANPELEAELAAGRDSEGRVAVGITQRFPLTARLRWERRLSALAIEAARLEVRERERQLAAAVRSAWAELAADREAVALARRQAESAQALARSLAAGATEGLASGLDAGQAALAAEALAAGVDSQLAAEAASAGRLATLLGIPAGSEIRVTPLPAPPRTLPANRSPGFRADVRLAELAVESGAVDVSLARSSRWDDMAVGLFAEGERFRDEPEGIEPEVLLGVRFNVPLPLWQNGSGAVAEKQAAARRQRAQLAAVRLAAVNDALAAHRALAARHRAAGITETRLLPAARRHAAEAEAAHRRGEIDVAALFRAREQLASAEAAALAARKDYHLAQSAWLAALGEPPAQP